MNRLSLGHEFKGGKFGGDYCRVQLARYPCGRPEADHAVLADDSGTEKGAES